MRLEKKDLGQECVRCLLKDVREVQEKKSGERQFFRSLNILYMQYCTAGVSKFQF